MENREVEFVRSLEVFVDDKTPAWRIRLHGYRSILDLRHLAGQHYENLTIAKLSKAIVPHAFVQVNYIRVFEASGAVCNKFFEGIPGRT